MPSGKLQLAGKTLQIVFTSQKGKEGAVQTLARSDLSRQLAAVADDKLGGLEVEFDFVGGSPKKVRPVGQPFEPQGAAPAARGGPRPQGGGRPFPGGARPAA